MTEQNERAIIGDNNPPEAISPLHDKFIQGVKRFNEASKAWDGVEKIETEEQAEKIVDFLGGSKRLSTQIETARKKNKEPILAAGKKNDAEFNSLNETVSLIDQRHRPKLDAYLAEKRKIAEAAEAKARAEAAEAQRIADEAAAAAAENENDLIAQQEAEDAKKRAEQQAKAAAKPTSVNVKSATGAGRTVSQRATRHAEITSIGQLFLHYKNDPKVAECLLALANADIRAKDVDETKIPGITIKTTHKSA